MTNLEKSALRIAELMGWIVVQDDVSPNLKLLLKGDTYAEYNGLMPIVFECNKSDIDYSITINPYQVKAYPCDEIDIYDYNTEPKFIEAIQECVIKFLELKNG